MAVDSLTDLDIAILELEGRWWKYAGSKEQAIRDDLGITPVRFYQRLNQLLESEAALHRDPVLVNRCRRLRTRSLTAR